ncbi:nucleotidyltransferase [Corallococcus exercitus]|uniref:SMODS domain-containing nucleotidyltransferase n=1 Tax=Corallococcus exercitus TaxID=2316736 RepID=UPI000EA3802C|nr:nucleotidyltransferase [Corallococcus exercitus]
MPRTVDEAFRDFLFQLTPTVGESNAAKSHRASIESCLRRNFGLNAFFRTGSFGNGTSISGYSDVDYFAELPTSELTANSSYSLVKVRNALDASFPRTNVRVDCPAIKVPFGVNANESTEVVPADLVGRTSGGYRLYDIADCESGWRRSSPDASNEYVRAVDARLNGRVKPLIRFVKAWKYFCDVPVSSFYLNMFVARYAHGESSIVYWVDIEVILRQLCNSDLPSMQDPQGISGYIRPCSSDVKWQEARSKLQTASARATKARDAMKEGRQLDAFDWWYKLFGGRFPAYYY